MKEYSCVSVLLVAFYPFSYLLRGSLPPSLPPSLSLSLSLSLSRARSLSPSCSLPTALNQGEPTLKKRAEPC